MKTERHVVRDGVVVIPRSVAIAVALALAGALALIATVQGTTPMVRARAPRSIAASFVTPDHRCFSPGSSNIYTLTVHNASTDLEWLDAVTYTLPGDWNIVAVATDTSDSCGNDVGFSASGAGTHQVTFTDDNGGWGEVHDGCSWNATVTVTVPVSVTGQQIVTWDLSGDDWGGLPHDIMGGFTLNRGLFFDADTLPGGAIPGDDVLHTMTLHNDTGGTQDISLAYSSTWPITGSTSLSSVASCSSVTLPVTVTVLSGAPTGTVDVATVTASGDGYTGTASLHTHACIPLASASLASDGSVGPGHPVQFTATVSPAGATRPIAHEWDFGESSSISGTDTATPVYTYTARGDYTVTVTVTGQCGDSASATISVPVGARIYLPVVVRNFTSGTGPTNYPPDTPASPTPSDSATGQSANVNLSWISGDPDGDSVTYDVYLEAYDSTPDVLVSDNQSGASYGPGTLITGTHYYWRVVATDEHKASTIGPVWAFTTTTGELPAARRYAIIVGVADYEIHGDLDYADDDATDLSQTILRLGNFREEDIRVLTDTLATKTAIRDAITVWLAPRERADDLVVFFFSGHGIYGTDVSPRDEADGFDEYLLPHDYDYTPDTAVRDDELNAWLDTLDSDRVVVIVDACFSGGYIDAISPEGTYCKCAPSTGAVQSSVMVGDGFIKDVYQPGRLVLTSSREDQLSWEFGPPYENGAFTYYLVNALETTTADESSNGWVSGEEAYDYLGPLVENLAYSLLGRRQNPQERDDVAGEVDLTKP